jgi:hypothetical protein
MQWVPNPSGPKERYTAIPSSTADTPASSPPQVIVIAVGDPLQQQYLFLADNLQITATSKQTLGNTGGIRNFRSIPTDAVDLSWLGAKSQDAASPESLTSLYKGIQQSLRKADYGFIDALFRAAEIPKLPAEALIAMLRYSFAGHKKITGWQRFLAAVRSELDHRGMDGNSLLAGLSETSFAERS